MDEQQEYQALPQYEAPSPPSMRMATAKEQAPLMKMLGKMISPKMKSPRIKGRIAPQSIKFGHKKKQQPKVPYY